MRYGIRLTNRFTGWRARCTECDWADNFDVSARDEAQVHAVETLHAVRIVRTTSTTIRYEGVKGKKP